MKENKFLYAQDIIKTNSSSVRAGFDMFLTGDEDPVCGNYFDKSERSQGYRKAKEMAEDGKVFFIHRFRCKCGGYPFMYGGFRVCNDCGVKNTEEDWHTIKVEKDGDKYCCHGLGFEDLQKSDKYAFGNTHHEAIVNYEKLLRKSKNYKSLD